MSTTGQSGELTPSSAARGKARAATHGQKPRNQRRTHGTLGKKCKFQHVEAEKGVLAISAENAVSATTVKESPHPLGAEESTSFIRTESLTDARANEHKNSDVFVQPSGPDSGAGVVYNISNFPVKSVVCIPWKAGRCVNGEKCRFSHAAEINRPGQSSEVVSSVREQNQKGRRGDFKRNKIELHEKQKELDKAKRLEEERLQKHRADLEAAEAKRLAKEARERQERETRAQQERETRERQERETRERQERERREQQERETREQQERERREQQERETRERELREERQRKANEARQRKEEANRRRKEERLRRQEVARRNLEAELEAKRLNEERITREKAEREAARRERQEQIKALREKEAAAIEQYVVSASSLITCTAGMNIQHVVSGFELCRITIQNLPNDAKRDEIADIFTQQGVNTSEFFILEVKPNGNRIEAVVLANADQGEAIALGLEGIEFRNETLSFQVSANASWSGMGASAQSTPFLTVSWWVPSETIIVTYDNMEKAREQVARLNSKIWNNRRIRVVMNERPNGAAARYFVPQSIKVFGCQPGSAVDGRFYEFVKSSAVRTLNSSNYDLTEMFRMVRDHVARSEGVQMHTYEIISDGNKADGEARIKVQFSDWEEAKRTYDTMEKRRLSAGSNYPLLRCWLPKPLQYSIKIPRQQYQAQKKQWDELSEKRADRVAHVHTRIGDRGDVFIRVLGQDKKAAGSLKVRVEGMIAGEKLDSSTHWHPSFASPRAKALFERVLATTNVYVRNDFKTRSLRVHGERERIEDAKGMIKVEVDRLANMETTQSLDQNCIRGFMREGLGKLKELLGEENVTVNIGTIPYRVTVKGGIEATHHLQRLIDESQTMGTLDDALPGDSEKETCPICYDEVSNPEELGCGHTYCSGCLHHFLNSAADTKIFPLVCMGNEAQCKVPIAIPSIRRFLAPHAFQNLVEATFVSYLEKHPQELKYCTTPDCEQIYRRRSDKTLLQCPSCFSTICPLCDGEAHEGMTCEERRIQQNPAEQERLNEELAKAQGFKKCPQCNVFIEKTYGCNHMTCRCGAHICWKCLGTFTAQSIYPHLQAAHGGYNDENPAGLNPANEDNNVFMAMQIQEIQRFERAQEAWRQQLARAATIPPAPVRAFQQPVYNAHGGAAGIRQPVQGVGGEELHLALEALRRRREAQEREVAAERQREETRIRILREQQLEQAVAAAEERRRREEDRGWCIVM